MILPNQNLEQRKFQEQVVSSLRSLSPYVSFPTSSETLDAFTTHVLVDATSGTVTITIPEAGTVSPGLTYWIKKIDVSANAVTVSRSGSDTIEGATSVSLASQYDSVILVSDGASIWYDYDT